MVCKPGYVSDLLMGYIGVATWLYTRRFAKFLGHGDMVAEGHSVGGLLENGRGDVKTPPDDV